MNEIEALQNTAINNRASYAKRLSDKKSQLEQQAQILGYDPERGLYRIQTQVGQISWATTITNGGSLYKGANVSLTYCPGSVGIIDTMPRG